jgi:hypothetical protein
MFRGAVEAKSRHGDDTVGRGDVDDGATPAAAHGRERGSDDVDEAEDVGLEHRADILVLALLDRGRIADAGIVHEHIDATMPRFRLGDHGLDLIRSREIHRQGQEGVWMRGGNIPEATTGPRRTCHTWGRNESALAPDDAAH